MMVNYCLFCGEEIPEDQAICDTCSAILANIPPEHSIVLEKLVEDKEYREKFHSAMQEVKKKLGITLAPLFAAVCEVIAMVNGVTEE